MEIYRYNPNCQEWEDIINSGLIGSKREEAFKECAKRIGTRLTLKEYFSMSVRESDWRTGICYRCIGRPSNILEELAYSEIEYLDELCYCHISYRHPEDLTESRTDWDTLKGYADDLASFIERIKDEIGTGRLKFE